LDFRGSEKKLDLGIFPPRAAWYIGRQASTWNTLSWVHVRKTASNKTIYHLKRACEVIVMRLFYNAFIL